MTGFRKRSEAVVLETSRVWEYGIALVVSIQMRFDIATKSQESL